MEPDDGSLKNVTEHDEDCTIMKPSFEWSDVRCINKYKYICKQSSDKTNHKPLLPDEVNEQRIQETMNSRNHLTLQNATNSYGVAESSPLPSLSNRDSTLNTEESASKVVHPGGNGGPSMVNDSNEQGNVHKVPQKEEMQGKLILQQQQGNSQLEKGNQAFQNQLQSYQNQAQSALNKGISNQLSIASTMSQSLNQVDNYMANQVNNIKPHNLVAGNAIRGSEMTKNGQNSTVLNQAAPFDLSKAEDTAFDRSVLNSVEILAKLQHMNKKTPDVLHSEMEQILKAFSKQSQVDLSPESSESSDINEICGKICGETANHMRPANPIDMGLECGKSCAKSFLSMKPNELNAVLDKLLEADREKETNHFVNARLMTAEALRTIFSPVTVTSRSEIQVPITNTGENKSDRKDVIQIKPINSNQLVPNNLSERKTDIENDIKNIDEEGIADIVSNAYKTNQRTFSNKQNEIQPMQRSARDHLSERFEDEDSNDDSDQEQGHDQYFTNEWRLASKKRFKKKKGHKKRDHETEIGTKRNEADEDRVHPQVKEIHIDIKSFGCFDPPYHGVNCQDTSASILIDGTEWSPNTPGINIVLLDFKTGKVENAMSFDTHGDGGAYNHLKEFFAKVENWKIICIAVKDDAKGYLPDSAIRAFSKIGATRIVNDRLEYRASYAFVGLTGPEYARDKMDWIRETSERAGSGPSSISTTVTVGLDAYHAAGGEDKINDAQPYTGDYKPISPSPEPNLSSFSDVPSDNEHSERNDETSNDHPEQVAGNDGSNSAEVTPKDGAAINHSVNTNTSPMTPNNSPALADNSQKENGGAPESSSKSDNKSPETFNPSDNDVSNDHFNKNRVENQEIRPNTETMIASPEANSNLLSVNANQGSESSEKESQKIHTVDDSKASTTTDPQPTKSLSPDWSGNSNTDNSTNLIVPNQYSPLMAKDNAEEPIEPSVVGTDAGSHLFPVKDNRVDTADPLSRNIDENSSNPSESQISLSQGKTSESEDNNLPLHNENQDGNAEEINPVQKQVNSLLSYKSEDFLNSLKPSELANLLAPIDPVGSLLKIATSLGIKKSYKSQDKSENLFDLRDTLLDGHKLDFLKKVLEMSNTTSVPTAEAALKVSNAPEETKNSTLHSEPPAVKDKAPEAVVNIPIHESKEASKELDFAKDALNNESVQKHENQEAAKEIIKAKEALSSSSAKSQPLVDASSLLAETAAQFHTAPDSYDDMGMHFPGSLSADGIASAPIEQAAELAPTRSKAEKEGVGESRLASALSALGIPDAGATGIASLMASGFKAAGGKDFKDAALKFGLASKLAKSIADLGGRGAASAAGIASLTEMMKDGRDMSVSQFADQIGQALQRVGGAGAAVGYSALAASLKAVGDTKSPDALLGGIVLALAEQGAAPGTAGLAALAAGLGGSGADALAGGLGGSIPNAIAASRTNNFMTLPSGDGGGNGASDSGKTFATPGPTADFMHPANTDAEYPGIGPIGSSGNLNMQQQRKGTSQATRSTENIDPSLLKGLVAKLQQSLNRQKVTASPNQENTSTHAENLMPEKNAENEQNIVNQGANYPNLEALISMTLGHKENTPISDIIANVNKAGQSDSHVGDTQKGLELASHFPGMNIGGGELVTVGGENDKSGAEKCKEKSFYSTKYQENVDLSSSEDKSVIKINGDDVSKDVNGFNLVVVDFDTGDVNARKSFDTQSDDGAARSMASYIRSLPDGKVILGATKGNAGNMMADVAYDALKEIGIKDLATNRLHEGDRYTFVAYKGKIKYAKEDLQNERRESVAQIKQPIVVGTSVESNPCGCLQSCHATTDVRSEDAYADLGGGQPIAAGSTGSKRDDLSASLKKLVEKYKNKFDFVSKHGNNNDDDGNDESDNDDEAGDATKVDSNKIRGYNSTGGKKDNGHKPSHPRLVVVPITKSKAKELDENDSSENTGIENDQEASGDDQESISVIKKLSKLNATFKQKQYSKKRRKKKQQKMKTINTYSDNVNSDIVSIQKELINQSMDDQKDVGVAAKTAIRATNVPSKDTSKDIGEDEFENVSKKKLKKHHFKQNSLSMIKAPVGIEEESDAALNGDQDSVNNVQVYSKLLDTNSKPLDDAYSTIGSTLHARKSDRPRPEPN